MANWFKREKIGSMIMTRRSNGFTVSYGDPQSAYRRVYPSGGKSYVVRTQHNAGGWTRRTRSKH
jgi:hypothetical protein